MIYTRFGGEVEITHRCRKNGMMVIRVKRGDGFKEFVCGAHELKADGGLAEIREAAFAAPDIDEADLYINDDKVSSRPGMQTTDNN